ncbi:hypothetical protein [Pseudomonas rhizoryzae]|uniref:hypothetical protein n=1 Tax=Pseudomonas rhizoryzae TaxID=2571129 RepID=UPI0010C1D079|nr:hypothetical protein [Pseudomonas rhizoryzae]
MTDRLTQLAASLTEAQEPFKVGDKVVWKDGLKHKRSEGPFIITEVLPKTIFAEGVSAGSPYFREPMTVKAAFFDNDEDLVECHFDARRFRLA